MAALASPDPTGRVPADDPLLGTKLHVRPPRPGLVPRSRLVALLDGGLACPLTLVSAPAGFGKTTLLVEWLARHPCPVAWVSLDPADDDPTVFLRYLVAALRTASPDVGRASLPLLRSPQPPPIESILTLLLNDLSALPHDLVIVLEDYHFIANPAVHSAVSFLLDRLPPRARLVIATRADPPLPLARLRSRGELVEVRADDLRFDLAEATSFLGRTASLHLADREIAALQARTEGWAAGLQLAALSLRGRPDAARFVEEFAGTHRYVVDYLLEEVLGREPDSVRAFLLQTSILDRLSGPLCDAVTGQANGEAMLERLERDNLFVVPLDDARQWYRYHHLFAEALRHQLRRLQPDAVGALHLRASEWYERHGHVDQAFGHALTASDHQRAADLVERNWNRLAWAGETNTVLRWLEALPEEVIQERPILATWYGWTLLFKGQIAQAESRLDGAEAALAAQVAAGTAREDEVRRAALVSTMAALRSLLLRHRGDLPGSVAAAQRALDVLDPIRPGPSLSPEEYASIRCSGYLHLAHAYREVGDTPRAMAAYVAGVPLARQAGNTIGVTTGTFYLARLHHLQGRLGEASETCREAFRYAAERGLEGAPAFALVHVALADVLRERHDLAEAERQLELGLDLGRRGGYLDAVKNGGIVLAALRQARGDLPGALAAIEEAALAVRGSGADLANAELGAYRARIWLRQGDLARTARWAESIRADLGEERGYTGEIEALTFARTLIAKGESSEALGLLDRLLASAERDGRAGREIEVRVLRALTSAAVGKLEVALADLRRALALGEPEGYARAFLDEGAELVALLRRGVAEKRWAPPLDRYVDGLLARLPAPEPTGPDAEATRPRRSKGQRPEESRGQSKGPAIAASAALADPLTEREREVLGLICEGLSNQEIADRLVVSLNTAKKHASNVLDKLGAANRTQAVLRARELGLG